MSEVERTLIKTGFWINHAQGPVLGATITIDQQRANIIIALTAVVVAIAAGSAFNLLLFAIYQVRTTPHPKDGLYWQQQALYRSLATPGTVFMDSLKFLHAWRRRLPRPVIARCLVPALCGLLFASGSIAAGVFSSYIVTTTDLEVLVRGDQCWFPDPAAWDAVQQATLIATVDSAARAFAQRCYRPGPLPSDCNFLIHPRIEPTLTYVDCPFEPDLCFNGTKAAVLDSGYLDSDAVFGINTPAKDRISMRRKATCVPLDTAAHTIQLNSSDPTIADLVADLYTPEVQQVNSWWAVQFGNSTIESGMPLSDDITTVHDYISSVTSTSYTFHASTAARNYDPKKKSGFDPIDGLDRDQGDIALLFLHTNNVASTTPIEDPIYSAHKEVNSTSGLAYHADHPISTLGCVQEYEYCVSTSGSPECTPLSGSISSFEPMRQYLPSANPTQQAILDAVAKGSGGIGLGFAAATSDPFLNITSRFDGYSYVLDVPADQWVLDFQALESYLWAYIRVNTLYHFTGFMGMSELSTIPPDTVEKKQVCGSQKVIEAGSFANVSVLGLAFTLAVAGALLLLDFVGLRMWTVRGQTKKLPSAQCWIDDGVYELQRRAYDPYIKVSWERTHKEVPVTPKDQKLDSLTKSAAAGMKLGSLCQCNKTSELTDGSVCSSNAVQTAKPTPPMDSVGPNGNESTGNVSPPRNAAVNEVQSKANRLPSSSTALPSSSNASTSDDPAPASSKPIPPNNAGRPSSAASPNTARLHAKPVPP